MKNPDYETDKKSVDDPYSLNITDDFKLCAATDCTGLIPAMPQTDSELEAYEEMYPFLTKARITNDDSHLSPLETDETHTFE